MFRRVRSSFPSSLLLATLGALLVLLQLRSSSHVPPRLAQAPSVQTLLTPAPTLARPSYGHVPAAASLSKACFPLPLPWTHRRRTGTDRWIIAYGLYGGENPRYVDALKRTVADLAPTLFPEWTVRIYHDGSLSAPLQDYFLSHGAELEIGPASVPNKMTWRFLPASDPDVERFLSRDADSFLTLREKWAVDEWVRSGALFHNMRDHPSGSQYSIMGGMWGAKRGAFPQMRSLLERHAHDQGYVADMNVLDAHMWPELQKNALQHDAFSCTDPRFHGGKPFPYPRIGWEIIGAVVVDPAKGKTRQGDIDIIKNARAPPECTPEIKPLRRVPIPMDGRVDKVDVVCSVRSSPLSASVLLVAVHDAFVDFDSHADGVWGTVFDQDRVLLPSRPIPDPDIATVFARALDDDAFMERTRFFPELAHALPSVKESGRFLTSVAPRLEWLVSALDPRVPILLLDTPQARAYVAHMSRRERNRIDESRIVWHLGRGHLHYARYLYSVFEADEGGGGAGSQGDVLSPTLLALPGLSLDLVAGADCSAVVISDGIQDVATIVRLVQSAHPGRVAVFSDSELWTLKLEIQTCVRSARAFVAGEGPWVEHALFMKAGAKVFLLGAGVEHTSAFQGVLNAAGLGVKWVRELTESSFT